MIRICSLDLLNKDVFETDVMTADGNVLFKTGDKITPEILLALYFKNIFVMQPLTETVCHIGGNSDIEMVSAVSPVATPSIEAEQKPDETLQAPPLPPQPSLELSSPEPAPPALEKEPINIPDAIEAPKIDLEPNMPTLDGPVPAAPDLSALAPSAQGPQVAPPDMAEGKGPKATIADLSVTEDKSQRGPVGPALSDPTLDEALKDETKSRQPVPPPPPIPEVVVPKEDPEDKQLEFDEQAAKRIIENSKKIGKMLNFSAQELKDLEQASYFINIGISKFKVRDMRLKNFRKMKLVASYEKVSADGLASNDIADVIKNCLRPYDGATFQLNSKIPYHHIVSITSFYEDLMEQTNSKQETIEKMLQLGGNNFNIFILHKFINMMRNS